MGGREIYIIPTEQNLFVNYLCVASVSWQWWHPHRSLNCIPRFLWWGHFRKPKLLQATKGTSHHKYNRLHLFLFHSRQMDSRVTTDHVHTSVWTERQTILMLVSTSASGGPYRLCYLLHMEDETWYAQHVQHAQHAQASCAGERRDLAWDRLAQLDWVRQATW